MKPWTTPLLFVAALLYSAACREIGDEPSQLLLKGPDVPVTVTAIQYDEFNRTEQLRGPVSLTLVVDGFTRFGTIPDGSTSYTFYGVPGPWFILRATKNGFYPYETTSTQVQLYPLPSAAMRIDTIQAIWSSLWMIMTIRLVTAQSVPPGGYRDAVIFLGRTPNVNSVPGNYFKDIEARQLPGSKELIGYLWSGDSRISSGMRIYVTARLMTGGTRVFSLDTLYTSAYTNLEENTNVVTSFIIP